MSVDKSAVKNDAMALPDFSKWEEEQVGFAPYWNPEPLKWFLGRVVARDERDPDFVRYLMKAEIDTPCKRGPVTDAEDVMIRKGEFFSISVYHSLEGLFNAYLEMGFTPAMKVTAVKEVPTKKSGQTWKVQVSPDDKKLLTKKRTELQLEAKKNQERQLSESNDAFPPS
jgi:hypothetical protein